MEVEKLSFIDFEAFQHKNEEFHIKELCILIAEKPFHPLHYIFKNEKPWSQLSQAKRRTYKYQEKQLHHLSWNEAASPFRHWCAHCIKIELESLGPLKCYVLGRQKADYLRSVLSSPLINIVEYTDSCKKLSPAPSHLVCTYRDHSREHCALLKCYRMMFHYYYESNSDNDDDDDGDGDNESV